MTTELQAAAVELQQSEAKRAELLPDDVEINHLIKQLDMGEPDYSDYSVVGHYFDAQDRHNKAMSMIRHRLFAIPQLRAHIAALEEDRRALAEYRKSLLLCEADVRKLEAENKRLLDTLSTCDGRILNAQIGINTGDTKAGLSKYLDAVLLIIRKSLAQGAKK